MDVRPVADVIASEFDVEWYRDDLASLVGDRTPDELASWLGALCRAQLQHDVVGARFAGKSVGAVFGLVLESGAEVVLKVFPRMLDERALRAIERCHAHVQAAGFPAPRQLSPIFAAGDVRAAFYELVEGKVLDAHEPGVRVALAESLAQLAVILRPLDATDLPVAPTRGTSLWGEPHRKTIDLARSGGEWIDARAREARRIIETASLPIVCTHYDWSAKNALFDAGRLRAALDWDSLVQASEAEALGFAAAAFTAHGGAWRTPSVPTREEANAFVRAYEQARGSSLSPVERKVTSAAADYLVAYVARQGFRGPDTPEDEYLRLLRATATEPLVDVT